MARVVVITGGGTGIGAACPRLMRAAGDRVFITGRREAPLQAVADGRRTSIRLKVAAAAFSVALPFHTP
ncbi:SDR family NAD(P)-dependent oxidoreductase, partial [Klebsiella pneumoniae]|uniref:SDR family NAD(P)-dependent oxidoreductase n=1 Tax=Klebsiella pneumoniae TaxID=573 RepID=UPI0022403917